MTVDNRQSGVASLSRQSQSVVTVGSHRLAVALALCVGVALAVLHGSAMQPAKSMLVYIGTYSGAKSKGIYVSRLDLSAGTLSAPILAAESANPSFLAVHPTRDLLYAVNEIGNYEGKVSGSVSAFAINRETGALTALNRQPSVGGGPAHLSVDHGGRNVLVANYGGGSVTVLPIGNDGALKPASAFIQHTGSSVNAQRQKEPHAHSVIVDPADRFVYVADLGLDKVMIYRLDAAKGSLVANDPAFVTTEPGAGPRHFALHPKGRFAYVINEILNTVTAFTRDPERGGLTALQTISTLPSDQKALPNYSTAELLVHPSGKFLYGSNRGHDSIAVFSIDEKSGRLTFVETQPTQGSTPRGFGIDPTGGYLLVGNQRSDSVIVFRIDPKTGRLTPTGSKIEVGSPVSVKFVSAR
jgi:6-phosphogluconolactonase